MHEHTNLKEGTNDSDFRYDSDIIVLNSDLSQNKHTNSFVLGPGGWFVYIKEVINARR
jgi:hypothetical protein